MRKKLPITIELLLCTGMLLVAGCGSSKDSNATDPNEKLYIDFSKDSGCYAEDFELELSTALEGSIYYTTDGSNPSDSNTSVLYTGAIDVAPLDEGPLTVSAVDPDLFCTSYSKMVSGECECYIEAPSEEAVDRCITVRAAVRAEDGTWSGTDTCTYFIGTMGEHIPGLVADEDDSGADDIADNEADGSNGASGGNADSGSAEALENGYTGNGKLAVISITMDYDDLFDYDTGIYVKGAVYDKAYAEYTSKNGTPSSADDCRKIDANYSSRGKEWEREAHIDFFEADEAGTELVVSQDCGIRIQGNYSRSDLQKSFRLYAREKYGNSKFDYAVFGDEATDSDGNILDKFDTMVLRAGGNCAFTAKFNDAYWQTLVAMDGSLDIATKASRACVVYLNGEYWGLYVLEEDYSEDYFEDHYGVDGGSVVAYKGDAEKYASGYKLDLGDVPEGEEEDYYFSDLMNFFDTHINCKSQEDYDELCSLVDEESVLDYFAVEVWINNKWDWPGKNWEMWRVAENTGDSESADEEKDTANSKSKNSVNSEYSDGRWRLTLFDDEFGGVSGSSDAKTNTIAEDNYKPKGLLDKNTSNPAVLCFAYLMDNDDFRSRYIERLEYLSDNTFEKEHALEVLGWFEDEYSPFYEQFFNRYPESGTAKNALTGGYASSSCIRAFLFKRSDYIPTMIEKSLKTN